MFFLGFFMVLFVLWWASGAGQKGADGQPKSLITVPKIGNPVITGGGSDGSQPGNNTNVDSGQIKHNEEGEPLSPYQGKIFISSLGTASGQYDPDFEYIVLEAQGNQTPVNITGWSLMNGRNRNAVALGITQARGVASQVYLPEARLVYLVPGLDFLQPIRLSSGQEVVVTTGRTPDVGSYYGSFKTNVCLGYLEDDDEKFYPALKTKCPDPEVEPGIEFVNDKCREFIGRMDYCHTPKFRSYTEVGGERESKPSVDNVSGLTSSCRDYLREHYNYRGCVSNHLNDKNFYGNQWRVYLNRPWEMWAKSGEVVTLFDERGLIVDRKSY